MRCHRQAFWYCGIEASDLYVEIERNEVIVTPLAGVGKVNLATFIRRNSRQRKRHKPGMAAYHQALDTDDLIVALTLGYLC